MDRGVWWTTVRGATESDMAEHTHTPWYEEAHAVYQAFMKRPM